MTNTFAGLKKDEVIVQIRKYDGITFAQFQRHFCYEMVKLCVMQGLLPKSYLTKIDKKQIGFDSASKKVKSLIPQMINGVHYKKYSDTRYAMAITVFATENGLAN